MYMAYSLRPLTMEDRDIIYQWRNSDAIRVNMYNHQFIPYDRHCQWFDQVLKGQMAFYRIFASQNIPLGLVAFKDFNAENQTCFWGFYIGERSAPKGSGTIMGYLAIDYAFNELNIRKLIGEVFGFNEKSEKFHQRFGFRREGLFKNELNRNGQFIDVIRFALFKEEWELHRKNLNLSCMEKGDEGWKSNLREK